MTPRETAVARLTAASEDLRARRRTLAKTEAWIHDVKAMLIRAELDYEDAKHLCDAAAVEQHQAVLAVVCAATPPPPVVN